MVMAAIEPTRSIFAGEKVGHQAIFTHRRQESLELKGRNFFFLSSNLL